MIFENPQIDTTQLPSVNTADYKRLSPAYKTTEYIGTAILFTFLFIGATIFFFSTSPVLGMYRYAIYVLWILLFSLSMFLVSKRYEMAGYALRENDVIHKHGVWWQVVTTIPFNRMQHCEISQGPIQNAFGLATLRVFTAGGTSSDLSIDGLDHEEAKRIKDFITGKISGQSAVSSEQSTEDSGQWAAGENEPQPQTTSQEPQTKENLP